MAAIRACSMPIRLAMRGRSWLPRTQLGHPLGGNAASYSSISLAIDRACHGALSRLKLNGRCTPARSRP
jgi:hypothetical protein